MDFIKKFTDDGKAGAPANPVATEEDSKKIGQSGSDGGLLDRVSSALGGGAKEEESEKTEQSGSGGGLFDKVSSALGGGAKEEESKKAEQSGSGGGLFGKVNNALGGGAKGEKEEDALDKTVDWVQEHVLKQGQQTNESAIEQAKDEAISDAVRKQFKAATGHDIPIADK